MSPDIPIGQIYRGVGIHDAQPPARIAAVKFAIDLVMAENNPNRLIDYAKDSGNPPEARLLAAAKAEGFHQRAAEDRTERPKFDLAYVRACVAGLKSKRWRHRRFYCSLFDVSPPGQMRAVAREQPLADSDYDD